MSTVYQSFEAKELKKRPLVIKIADKMTSMFGSLIFLLFNLTLFSVWILINQNKVPAIPPFDAFPYQLLTTIVSLEAIFLTIIVLMSQNRQNHVSTIRQEIDMQINRISEKEITKALYILKKLAEKQNIKIEDKELDEMLRTVEIPYIERKLEEQLTEEPSPIVKEVEKVVEKMEEKVEARL